MVSLGLVSFFFFYIFAPYRSETGRVIKVDNAFVMLGCIRSFKILTILLFEAVLNYLLIEISSRLLLLGKEAIIKISAESNFKSIEFI